MTESVDRVAEKVISLVGVTKRYGDVTAAHDVTFDVYAGEFLVLLGPSGCGKSTLLRLLCGLDSVDAGRIERNGTVLSSESVCVPPEARGISLVFQDNALFPHMTVWNNIAFGLANQPKEAAAERVAEMLDLVRLRDVATRYPHELSGGQQQRVALARALAPKPSIVLLDEPFSDLDRSLRIGLREEVRAVLRSTGTAAILVTHDQEEALALGDRIAVQNDGRIEQVATPEALFGDPASRFVAEFIGATDFLAGEIASNGILTEIGALQQETDAPIGTAVEVAVRPDDVTLSPDPAAAATVVSRSFNGMSNVYRIRLPSGAFVHSLQPHTLILADGTPVRVKVEPGHKLAYFPNHGGSP